MDKKSYFFCKILRKQEKKMNYNTLQNGVHKAEFDIWCEHECE